MSRFEFARGYEPGSQPSPLQKRLDAELASRSVWWHRLWVALRVGQYTLGVWPFNPPRSFCERELTIDSRQVGLMIGVSDA